MATSIPDYPVTRRCDDSPFDYMKSLASMSMHAAWDTWIIRQSIGV